MAKNKKEPSKRDKTFVRKIEKSIEDKRAAFMKGCDEDVELQDFEQKKRIILYALKLCKGNVTNACKMITITRKTFHNYRNEDPEFEETYRSIKLGVLDHVVSKLHQNIDEGKETSIIYYLNCQGKEEGWGNNVNIDHTTKGDSLNKTLKNMTDEELVLKLKEINEKMK